MKLHPVTFDDAEFLYALLKERPKYANISHQRMPSFPEHQAFIASNPYETWYIVEDESGFDCGSVYLSKADEIGVAIWSTERGKGYGRKAVTELMRLHPRRRFLANIAPMNTDSLAFFGQFGFKAIQVTMERRT